MSTAKRGEPWAKEQWKRRLPMSFPRDWSDDERSVSGEFLLELLLNPDASDIVLVNAVVNTPVDFRYARVRGEIQCDNCRFDHQVSLQLANFERRARFRGCAFNDDLDLTACTISYLWFDATEDGVATTFAGAVELLEARITGQLICRKAAFTAPDKQANFQSIRVSSAAVLDNAEFAGPVDLSYSKIGGLLDLRGGNFREAATLHGTEIGGSLYCNGAKFLSSLARINFENLRIGGDGLFSDTVFHGPVSFNLGRVGGALDCTNTVFESEEQPANFTKLEVGSNAFFRGAVFHGPVNFNATDFGGYLICDGASFRSRTGSANFNDIKVKGHAQFDAAHFSGPADFSVAMFASTLLFRHTEFANEEATVNFYGAKIGTYAICEEATFKGPVNLAGVEISGDLRCDKTQFLSAERPVSFDRLRVKGDAYFRQASFQGPVNFVAAEIDGLLNCTGAQFLDRTHWADFSLSKIAKVAIFQEATFAGGARFSRAEIGGLLNFLLAKFLDEQRAADFIGVKVGGDAIFSKAAFEGGCDFFGADLAETVRFDEAIFGKRASFAGVAIAGNGIFNQAIFKEGVDFRVMNVTAWLLFNFSVFNGETDFSLSRFGNVLEFNGATFRGAVSFNSAIVAGSLNFSPGKIKNENPRPVEFADAVSFRSCKIAGDVNCYKARFQGTVLFSQAEVGGDAHFEDAHFSNGSADFRSVVVRGNAYFNAARFATQADFRFAYFAGDANFIRAAFGGAMDFTGVRLRGSGYFAGSEFSGGAQFRNAAIEGDLRFELDASEPPSKGVRVVFKASVDGDGLKVGGELAFTDCMFAPEAELALRTAAIGILNCNKTEFASVTCFSAQFDFGLLFTENVVAGEADFSVSKVTGRASFNGTIFKKACDFREAALGGLTAFNVGVPSNGASPAGPCTFESVVSFDKARIAGAVKFHGTVFKDRASFVGTLFADEVEFARGSSAQGQPSPEKLQFNGEADFRHAIFSGQAAFVEVLFKKAVRFSKSRFQSRIGFDRVDFSDPTDDSAGFAEVEFQSQVVFLECTVAGRLAFYGAKAQHILSLDTSCQFNGLVDFKNAQLSILRIATFRATPANFSFLQSLDLSGCTYRRITCDTLGIEALWKIFRTSLEPHDRTRAGSASFERQPYIEFEHFCRDAGANELADAVYFDLRGAEGKLERRTLFWLWNWGERLAFGYGVRPLRMVVVFLLALLGGTLAIALSPPTGAAWDDFVRASAISFTNLVPGIDKLLRISQAPGTVGAFRTAVAVAQYCLGWALLALLAHRFFRGLKR